jgi:uncharacterized protein YdhG (YjbR/CyaY superfamily)
MARARLDTVEQYIDGLAEEVRAIFENLRATIKQAAPNAKEAISYGIPTFDLNGRHLLFIAAWKRHISIYPLPGGDEALQQDLSPYKREKGTIQFPLSKPIPYDLVRRIAAQLITERAG